MAGPTIVVRVLGDLASLAKSFESAKSKGSEVAGSMHAAFSGVLGALNQSGVLGPFGDALNGVDTALDQISKHGKDTGLAMAGVGTALAGIGVGLSAVGSKDQAAHQQLQAAVEATGASYEDYAKQVDAAVKHQEKFGDTANQTQDALRILTTATNSPTKALQLLSTATDLAAAKHEDLGSAATALGKVYNGNTKLLKEYGIQVTSTAKIQSQLRTATTQSVAADAAVTHAKRTLMDVELVDSQRKKLTLGQQIQLRNAQEAVTTATAKATTAHQKLNDAQKAAKDSANNQGGAVTALATKLHGQASAAADTFGGHISAIRAHLEDTAATLGQKYGPALTAAGTAVAGLGAAITVAKSVTDAFAGAQKAQQLATEGVTAAELASDAAGLPLYATIGLIVLAVAALVAIGYVIYRNWNTIWTFIKKIVVDVWDWIKVNWPLLLGILLGPIALAVALIWKYWSQITGFFAGTWNWISSHWPLLLAIITGPIGLAVRWIIQNWGTVTGIFQGLISWFSSTWTTVTGYITGPFHAAFDAIANLWNNTVGSLSFKVPSWVPGLGGKGFSVPHIPALAQGGLITATGLVYAHAGEVISPTPAGVGGPFVNIEQATFNSGIDVDLFMQRAAWAARTRAS